MTLPRVLISGAGIAGPTLAYWLARSGWQPTVIERSDGLRSSGNPVDVRGLALSVAERMGIVAALQAAATPVRAMSLYDRVGHRFARLPTPAGRSDAGTPELELPRSDLAHVLFQAAHDDTEVLFGDTITALQQDADGVEVTFERHAARRFDLVIGADGLHSTVRRLVFGPDGQFVRHMGMYVATTALQGSVELPQDVLLHNTPGRLVAVHPGRDHAMVGFFFRQAAADVNHRDLAAVKRFVAAAYAGVGWRVPELLEQLHAAPDVYFDAVSVVQTPRWSQGRVALLGDAASCLSLFGEGSSLAMAGAYTLAQALSACPHDHALAFRRFEAIHRAKVAPKLRHFGPVASLMVPRSSPGLMVRNLAARLLSYGSQRRQ
ncbi:FAD-dependent monooxygenase [Deinococcus marmoris]|uniref:Monooxygenase, FAD-binding n=2 Tax=Deinococcus marmoris TaxID=249408 RepID=A0A1U7P0N1_9DEIO|nr:FAD-dependent monooxygenase [Deinococcus marmoris]OLV18724.1 monooxygenase, FAD-binding [Deinococcus marmoris]